MPACRSTRRRCSAAPCSPAAGARQIIAIDLAGDKLQTARALGATHTVNAGAADALEQVRALSSGGVEFAFECLPVNKLLTGRLTLDEINHGFDLLHEGKAVRQVVTF